MDSWFPVFFIAKHCATYREGCVTAASFASRDLSFRAIKFLLTYAP